MCCVRNFEWPKRSGSRSRASVCISRQSQHAGVCTSRQKPSTRSQRTGIADTPHVYTEVMHVLSCVCVRKEGFVRVPMVFRDP